MTMRSARHAAMDLLARREHSRHELRRKLCNKGYDAQTVDVALDALSQEGLLSDERFAQAYARYRGERGFGPLRIRQELQQHGLSEALIAEALLLDAEVWQERLQRVWQKRFAGTPPQDASARAKQIRFLVYRGFAHDDIDNFLRST